MSSGSPPRRHDHGARIGADRRLLVWALVLIVAFMVFEVVAAVLAGSLALLADAGHMLTDAGAIAGAIWATQLAARPATDRYSFGWKRAEILSAALNGITLLVVAVAVAFEAIRRLLVPPHVHGAALVAVAAVGVAVNLSATLILSRGNTSSVNLMGALAHILTDLYAFAGTFVAGVIILAVGYERADPIASLVVVGLMMFTAVKLLGVSGRVLLEGTPESVDLDDVRRHLAELPEVLGVHEVHAWTLTSNLPVLSAHVVVVDACLADGSAGRVIDRLQECLVGHFDVEHSTFQLEPASHIDHERPEHV